MGNDTTTFPLCAAGNTNGCSVAGIEQLSVNNEQVKIYPNPSSGSLQVTVSNKQVAEIKMYDVTGKLVLSLQPTPNPYKEENSFTIDASSLSEGVYNMSITNNEGTINKK